MASNEHRRRTYIDGRLGPAGSWCVLVIGLIALPLLREEGPNELQPQHALTPFGGDFFSLLIEKRQMNFAE